MNTPKSLCIHKRNQMIDIMVKNTKQLLGLAKDANVVRELRAGVGRGLIKKDAGVFTYYDLSKVVSKPCKQCAFLETNE